MKRDRERIEAQVPARWTGASWRTITLVVTALAVVATVVALIVIQGGANRQRDRALQAQAHSYDVMILARTLAGTIARSEASLGRYVISGDRQLGQIYVDQWQRAGAEIDLLDRLTLDNVAQQHRIDALRASYDARDRELSLIALSTNYHKNGQAIALWYRARQAPSLARIDAVLEQIIASERERLNQRTAAASASVDRASHIAGALAVVGVLLVLGGIALGWMTVTAVGERLTARADADAAQHRADQLAAAVGVATDELRVQEAKLRQIQKMEAVGQLTGGIAHDFNNMLAVVLGGLELARRHVHADPAAAARHLDSAREGADRAAALTRRLLAFSREEALRPEPIDPGALVAGMSELLDRTLGDAITVVTRDDGGGRCVRADRVQLENALLNLAVNARDAMGGRGTLTIVTDVRRLAEHEIEHCRAGEYVTIAVRDTGHGMSPEVAERVFEPFFTTKEAGRGTGLGLSQIFALVRQLSGEIAIDTAPERGTEVTLFLPCDAGAVAAVAANVAAPSTPGASAALNILVVEDDPRVLATTAGALAELGHAVVTCDDPLAASAMLDGHPAIDLILSDVLMPRQTGPEMIAALPSHHDHLAVLFVTGFAGEAAADEFGNRPVLRKPFTLAGLERAIEEAMSQSRPAPSARIAAE